MLRNLGIRSKILAVLALPVLVLVLAAGIISGGAIGDARSAAQIEKVAGQAPGLTQLVRNLQAERTLSMAVLSGDRGAAASLAQARSAVDQTLQAVRASFDDVNLGLLDESAQQAVAASATAHEQLAVIRPQVDGAALSPSLAAQGYAQIIATDVALPERIAEAVTDRDLAAQLRAYSATERLAELITQERDLGATGVAAGLYSDDLRAELTDLMAHQDAARLAATEQAERLGVRLPALGYPLQLARQRTIADADGVIDGINLQTWLDAGQAEIDALASGQSRLAAQASARSAALANEASGWAFQVAVGAALLVVLPLLLALFIARGITRPLRRLTEAAGHLRSELPLMVERMHSPGEGPGLTLPDIPVESGDEIGRLATAFNDVNATTVQVAAEQAALRGSIAAMFVNVARRDQVLLSRQLAFIDQLERSEENPATLDNLFRLDHLATRMRRNAESLLVLAGIDTGRRLRRPMPLSDVIRTASSEIEHYERVDLALRVDPPMVGHMALSSAHLLAELLENATRFSDPGTRVVVSTGSNERGVVVTVTDEGLGLSPDELVEANAKIAEPPISEAVGAQRLGFFVVGRLARKLDATVTLRAGRSRGTIVTIELPPALFVPGSVVELPAKDQDASVDEAPTGHTEISLPDTSAAALAATGETGGAPSTADADAATPVRADVPAPIPSVTDAGLPRRGTSGLPMRKPAPAAAQAPTPAIPVPLPAAAAAAPTAAEEAVLEEAEAEADVSEPTRDAPESAASVLTAEPVTIVPAAVPAPRAEAPQSSGTVRSGLFSSFRSRRPEAADATTGPGSRPVHDADDAAVEADVQPDAERDVERAVEPVAAPAAAVVEPAVEAGEPVEAPVEAPAAERDEPVFDVKAAVLAEVAANQPPAPAVGAPALDILPGGGRGGRSFRIGRKSHPAPAPATPVHPMTRRELRRLEHGESQAPVAAPAARQDWSTMTPTPYRPAAPAAPNVPAAPAARPTPAAFAPAASATAPAPAPVAPVMPPPSLFGNAPATNGSAPAPVARPVQAAAPVQTPAVQSPPAAPAPQPVGDVLRQRSALASQALTELSRLSTYRPAAVSTQPTNTLSRRTPAASPAAELAPPPPTTGTVRRARNASDVRSMLSGFQAGVERGRTTPPDNRPATSTD